MKTYFVDCSDNERVEMSAEKAFNLFAKAHIEVIIIDPIYASLLKDDSLIDNAVWEHVVHTAPCLTPAEIDNWTENHTFALVTRFPVKDENKVIKSYIRVRSIVCEQ